MNKRTVLPATLGLFAALVCSPASPRDADNEVQVTFGPVAEAGTACSRGGKWLAFEYMSPQSPEVQIWVMPTDSDFSGAYPVATDGDSSGPSWSPDGKWVSFVDHRKLSSSSSLLSAQVYKASIATKEVIQLTQFPTGTTISGTAWSPKGRVVFEWDGDIYVVSGDGGEPEMLFDLESPDFARTPEHFKWSPDGNMLAFVWYDRLGRNVERRSLWLGNATTKELQQLTTGHEDRTPTWVESDTLVFSRVAEGSKARQTISLADNMTAEVEFPTKAELYSFSLRDKKPVQLTAGPFDFAPCASRSSLFFSRGNPSEHSSIVGGFHIWRKELRK